jgi:ATP-binding protein involved in chromosome partitioning
MITIENIKEELSNVSYPGFTKSIVEFGFVKDIAYENNIAMIFVDITSSDSTVEDTIRANIVKELTALGIKDVQVSVSKPKAPQQKSNSQSGQDIAQQVKNFIMISSGKGGVGKSSTSVNLAVALAMQGKKVGLLDADIYDPNIPRMMGLENQDPEIIGAKVMLFKAYGVRSYVYGFFSR